MAELRRRLTHMSGAGLPGLYLLDQYVGWGVVGYRELQYLLLAGAVVALLLEAGRLSGLVEWAIYDRLTREYEQEYLAGYALYMIGMAGSVWLFAARVAVPATLMLAIADPISGLLSAGSLTKRARVLVVTFGICLLLAVPFVPLSVAVLGAATAALADGIKPVVWSYVVDDNLTIPLGASAVMAAALAALPPELL